MFHALILQRSCPFFLIKLGTRRFAILRCCTRLFYTIGLCNLVMQEQALVWNARQDECPDEPTKLWLQQATPDTQRTMVKKHSMTPTVPNVAI